MDNFVGADHEFHNKDFAQGWADRFVPTPERLRLFGLIYTELAAALPTNSMIVELGTGPGYLASYLLERLPNTSYCGIDFSTPMIEIARQRLQPYSGRISFIQSDLVDDAWDEQLAQPIHAIVSTWALHDLGSPENIFVTYQRSYRALSDNGILLNGDFIKPDLAKQTFEAGRFEVNQHLELLQQAGFANASCLALFEEELENPTAAQNYACMKAAK